MAPIKGEQVEAQKLKSPKRAGRQSWAASAILTSALQPPDVRAQGAGGPLAFGCLKETAFVSISVCVCVSRSVVSNCL